MDDAERSDVRSIDGTSIAVWTKGQGPALVMVHGSIADHTTFASFIEVLGRDFSVFALDRRGFGASGDSAPYAIERDFEDIACVVDAVALRTGGPVAMFAHSYGASCAMGAATRTRNLSQLILYEPSLGLRYPPGLIDTIDAALASGDRERTLELVLKDILELTDAEIRAMRSSPLWPLRLAVAHTVPRECRVEDEWRYAPGDFDAITVKTLLLQGSKSTPALIEATVRAAEAIPNARIHVLEGHAHLAHKVDPELIAGLIREVVAHAP